MSGSATKSEWADGSGSASTAAALREAGGGTAVRVVGVLFLAAMLAYGTGSGIVSSILDAPDYLSNVASSRTAFTTGAVLMLVNAAVVAGIGILLFPVLRRHSERIAVGYLTARAVEGVLLAVGVVGLLSVVTVGEEYVGTAASGAVGFEPVAGLAVEVNEIAYQVAMAGLGVGSVFLCFLLYRTRLVPRALAAWGLVGYAGLTVGAVLELFGTGVGLLLSVPGGLFELFFGVWLIVKGFREPAVPWQGEHTKIAG